MSTVNIEKRKLNLLREIEHNKPGAVMAERWLWLLHRRMVKHRDEQFKGFWPLWSGMMAVHTAQAWAIMADLLAMSICSAKNRAEHNKKMEVSHGAV